MTTQQAQELTAYLRSVRITTQAQVDQSAREHVARYGVRRDPSTSVTRYAASRH